VYFQVYFLCKNFGDKLSLEPYEKDDPYHHHHTPTTNGSATTVLEGFDPQNILALNGSLPNAAGRIGNGDTKRPSLRRLLSAQSTLTQMSDITEDRELEPI
jgi:hypothetical protein